MDYGLVRFTVQGLTPHIQHNGQLADPLNKFAKQLKVLTSKRKKTDEDYMEMSRVEFHGGIYTNNDGLVIIPSECIEAALVTAAKNKRLGTHFQRGVFVEKDSILEFPDKGKTPTELFEMGSTYVFIKGVRVGESKVMRTRPMFREWSTAFEVSYDPAMVNRQDVIDAVHYLGQYVGLSEWRPRYGRFLILDVADVQMPTVMAAPAAVAKKTKPAKPVEETA